MSTVRWTCPLCSRVKEEDPKRAHLISTMCAGDPVTGKAHAPIDMERSEPSPTVDRYYETMVPTPTGRLVADLDILKSMMRTPPAGVNWCPHCDMVEVDNPMRREIRHQRGCPSTWSNA